MSHDGTATTPVIHAETSFAIADHHASAVRLILESKEWHHFQIYGRNYANYYPEIF